MAALFMEVRPFLRRVNARRVTDLGLEAWEFFLERANANYNSPKLINRTNTFSRKPKIENRKPIKGLAVVTGMGPDAARRGAQGLQSTRPRLLVSLGFAGALIPDLAPGDLVLGESFWDFDPDTGVLNQVSPPLPFRPLPFLIRELNKAGLHALSGSLVTTPYIIHKQTQGKPLHRLSRPVVDLETGVWARLAIRQGLPFLGLRAVTDAAGEEIPDFLQGAKGTVLEALGWLARDPARLGTLLHLWRRGRLAARRLAEALAILVPFLVEAGKTC
jgi:nucleoside phosphorylase